MRITKTIEWYHGWKKEEKIQKLEEIKAIDPKKLTGNHRLKKWKKRRLFEKWDKQSNNLRLNCTEGEEKWEIVEFQCYHP